MRLPSLLAVALVACAPHGPAAEGRALALPSVIVARPPRAMPGCMKGPRTAIPFFDRARGVPCDALPRHALGRPTVIDGRSVLLDEETIAAANVLARCDP
jgi:hypothetical protein